MSKPIYLPVELCKQLQSKGLECGSGVYWAHFPGFTESMLGRRVMDKGYGDYFMPLDEVRRNIGFESAHAIPCYELHIDILGSRENLTRLFPSTYEIKGTDEEDDMFAEHGADCMDNMYDQVKVSQLFEFILNGEPDQAINLIKEAV